MDPYIRLSTCRAGSEPLKPGCSPRGEHGLNQPHAANRDTRERKIWAQSVNE
jgi:hypothetical protein